ncbi:MAG: hypothetical protein RBS14_00080 [Atribacterota bacterium]|nr:hypothetical protein [Atribacterota bacterium]
MSSANSSSQFFTTPTWLCGTRTDVVGSPQRPCPLGRPAPGRAPPRVAPADGEGDGCGVLAGDSAGRGGLVMKINH